MFCILPRLCAQRSYEYAVYRGNRLVCASRCSVFDAAESTAGRPTKEDLDAIRTRKPERPMIEVTLADGSTRRLWCTFGPQQIDINPFSEPGPPLPLLLPVREQTLASSGPAPVSCFC